MDLDKELLKIFEDPLFANVHPRPPQPTENDVVREGFQAICRWSKEHGGRAPRLDRSNKEEWLLARQLQGIIADDSKLEMLRGDDNFTLLETIYDE